MSNARGPTLSQTWWGSRWVQSLRRFGRSWSIGLSKARGSTEGIHDLTIKPGFIEAVVPGEDGAEYKLQLRIRTLDDRNWRRILRRLASKALYAAKLLSGEMPRDIERVFAQCRASLFPRRRHEIEFECSCDEEYAPCSHVAAVQFVLAEAFDRDPFLLFELRGRGRDGVLSELREIRGSSASNDPANRDALADEDAWVQPQPEDYTVAGEDLATIGFHIAAAEVPVGTIRALGAPRAWPQPLALLQAMVPLYRAASKEALETAWGGEEEVPESARLPEPESEQALIRMAESMVESTAPSSDSGSRRRGRRRRRGGRRRRGRQGGGARPGAQAGGEGGTPGSSGKKRRRRRRRGGANRNGNPGPGGGDANRTQAAASGTGKKRRRRRRRRGGGGGGAAGGES